MTIEQFYVTLEDRDIQIHVRQRHGKGDRPPLLLLHGWPASSACWEPVIENLPDNRDYIYPDLRGLGKSERKGNIKNFEKQELARDISSLMTSLGINAYHVAGQDWGGIAAQELAMWDSRVQSLIIMNINLINNPVGSQKGLEIQLKNPLNPRWYMTFQSIPGFPENMLNGNEDLWIRYFFSQHPEGNTIPEASIQDYIRSYSIQGTPACGAKYYRAMPQDYLRWASLGDTKQTVSSLIIYGNQDKFLTPEFYEGHENCFTDVRKVELHAGHFVQDERPEEVAQEISKFLS